MLKSLFWVPTCVLGFEHEHEEIEDITWPCRDRKCLFECWKIFHEWAQWTSEIYFSIQDEIYVSPSGCVICSIYYINTNEIPNHFTWIVFWYERGDLFRSHSNGDIFTCEDNMLFSHVKISSCCAKAHLVFHCGLYNKIIYCMVTDMILIQF